jgi:hypothetical protein
MDASLKELTRLETLTASDGKSPSLIDSLDSLLGSLREAKEEFLVGNCTEEQLNQLTQTIESRKKDVEDRQKEVYSVMSRFGRTLDKVGRLLILSLEISSSDASTIEILNAVAFVPRFILLLIFCYCS